MLRWIHKISELVSLWGTSGILLTHPLPPFPKILGERKFLLLLAYKTAKTEGFVAASSLIRVLHGQNTCLCWQRMKNAPANTSLSCVVALHSIKIHGRQGHRFSLNSETLDSEHHRGCAPIETEDREEVKCADSVLFHSPLVSG